MGEDKWLDDILDSSEKQDICDKIKQAIDHIEGMRVVDALSILYNLFGELNNGEVKDTRAKVSEWDAMKNKIEDALSQHSHTMGSHHHGTVDGTNTYSSAPEIYIRRVIDEIHDMKRDLRDLFALIHRFQGLNPPQLPVSGTYTVPPPQSGREQDTEEYLRSLLRP